MPPPPSFRLDTNAVGAGSSQTGFTCWVVPEEPCPPVLDNPPVGARVKVVVPPVACARGVPEVPPEVGSRVEPALLLDVRDAVALWAPPEVGVRVELEPDSPPAVGVRGKLEPVPEAFGVDVENPPDPDADAESDELRESAAPPEVEGRVAPVAPPTIDAR